MSLQSNKPVSQRTDSEPDLGRLLAEILDKRKLISLIIGSCVVAAFVYLLMATPLYRANALVQIEQKQENALLSNISQMIPGSVPESAAEISLLSSRMVLGKTVDDLTLQAQIRPTYLPVVGRILSRLLGKKPGQIRASMIDIAPSSEGDPPPSLLLTVKDPYHYHLSGGGYELEGTVGQLLSAPGLSLQIKKIDAIAGSQFTINYIARIDAIQQLQQQLNVTEQGKDSGILSLTLLNSNPQLAREMLDAISNNYLEQNIARQAARDSKSLEFLKQQLPEVRNSLDQAEDQLSDYRKRSNSVDLTMQARSVLEQIVNVDNQLNQLTFREAEISQLFTKDHPAYRTLVEKRQTLQQEKRKLDQVVAAMPDTQQQVLKLSRDVESLRAVYMQLLSREQELDIARHSTTGYVRIIDSAVVDDRAVKPRKMMIVLASVIAGGAISAIVVILLMILRRGIESPEQLEEQNLNVLASVPLSDWLDKRQRYHKGRATQNKNLSLLALDNPEDLAIESIRSLRTSLHFLMQSAPRKILMISSASPAAGKTFISTNLAMILAKGGQRVLFIDADMRKGYCHQLFSSPLSQGLSSLLKGECSPEQSIKSIQSTGFDFISRGIHPDNPAELLIGARFNELLNWAESRYDIIVVDTPPILAVTDAGIIGSQCGVTVMVAHYNQNSVKEIEISRRRFEKNGVNVAGYILNGVIRKPSTYYTYGYYSYDYNYKDKS